MNGKRIGVPIFAKEDRRPAVLRDQYIKDMAIERDIINQNEYARQKGIAEGKLAGIAEGRKDAELQIARAMLARGMDAGTVAEITGLGVDQIKCLL